MTILEELEAWLGYAVWLAVALRCDERRYAFNLASQLIVEGIKARVRKHPFYAEAGKLPSP